MAYKQVTTRARLYRPVVYQNTYRNSTVLSTSHKGKTRYNSHTNGKYRLKTGSIRDKTSGYTHLIARSVLVFNLPNLPDYRSIDKATLHIWKHWDSNYPISGNPVTYVRQVTRWKSPYKSGWNNRPQGWGSATDSYRRKHHGFAGGGSWKTTFNVTSIVRNWYKGQKNLGIQLDSIGRENLSNKNNSWKKWWLDRGYEPYIEIKYTKWVPDPNKPPTVSMTLPSSGYTDTWIKVGCNAKDPDGWIKSTTWSCSPSSGVNMSNLGNKGGSIRFKNTGTYTLKVTVKDNKGASASTSKRIKITLPPNKDPIANFIVSKNDPYQREQISVIDQSYDPDGKIVKREWSISPKSGVNANLGNVGGTVVFTNTGTHTISLKVTDDRGGTNSTSTDIYVQSADPIARFSVDNSIKTRGEILTYVDSSYDPQGLSLIRSWSFSPSTGVVHDANKNQVYFTRLGTYTMTLTVKNALGYTSSASREITVENLQPYPAKPIYPINSSWVYNQRPIFYIEGVSDPDGEYDPRYKVRIDIAEDPDFTKGLRRFDSVSNPSGFYPSGWYTQDNMPILFQCPVNLPKRKWYYWRVWEHDGHEWSLASVTNSFYMQEYRMGYSEVLTKEHLVNDYDAICDAINWQRTAYGLSKVRNLELQSFESVLTKELMAYLYNCINEISAMHNDQANTELTKPIWTDHGPVITREIFQELIDNLAKV